MRTACKYVFRMMSQSVCCANRTHIHILQDLFTIEIGCILIPIRVEVLTSTVYTMYANIFTCLAIFLGENVIWTPQFQIATSLLYSVTEKFTATIMIFHKIIIIIYYIRINLEYVLYFAFKRQLLPHFTPFIAMQPQLEILTSDTVTGIPDVTIY